MFYCRRASPKHHYDIIEVDYDGGGHHTRLKDQLINCCLWGPPAPVYKGVEEGEGRPSLWRALGEKERGSAAPSLVQFGLAMGGHAASLVALLYFH